MALYVRPMPRRDLPALLIAFAISLVVRWPLLDRPLSAHHEYCTAFTLVALTNWWEDGFATHHGMPSGGWIREGEALYPAGPEHRNERAVGLYYFSHPPLAYDLPYVLFVLTNTAPNAAGLQWMNMFFHLLTAIGLYHAVRLAAGPERPQAPLFASVLYLFTPATLWFHGNAYMSDMFVQVPWVWQLVFAQRILRAEARPSAGVWAGFIITLLLTLYTSWLGVFALISVVLVAFLRWRMDRRAPIASIIGGATLAFAAAFGLTAWRYLQVIDAGALFAHFQSRFAVRGSFGAGIDLPSLLKQITVNYRISYLPLIILLLGLPLVRWRRGNGPGRALPHLKLFVALAGLPVLLDHLLLLQYAEHDFAALKAAPVLCGLAGVGLVGLQLRWRWAMLMVTCLAGVAYFYRTNPIPGHDGGRYQMELELGQFIAENAAPDELVFGVGIITEPQVTWYAHRNVLGVADEEAARVMLKQHGLSQGVVVEPIEGGYKATHIMP